MITVHTVHDRGFRGTFGVIKVDALGAHDRAAVDATSAHVALGIGAPDPDVGTPQEGGPTVVVRGSTDRVA
jgi:hypothetical protein